MLVRSFNAQYRGLTEDERQWLDEYPEKYHCPPRIERVHQIIEPIWRVGDLTLLCVKRDLGL